MPYIINMVGTRNATDYGKHICVNFLQELQMQCPDVLVVSGLAYGIDINAHRSALSVELPTVGYWLTGWIASIRPFTVRQLSTCFGKADC